MVTVQGAEKALLHPARILFIVPALTLTTGGSSVTDEHQRSNAHTPASGIVSYLSYQIL